MSGRVLNFSEFSGKYNTDTEKNLDTFTQSSANFEEGFDKETYDQPEIGPNRPVSGGSDATPPQPGETGTPKFSSEKPEDMSAPDETDGVETPEVEEEEPDENEEQPETDETPEPEAGSNPKKEEKVGESSSVMTFTEYLTESFYSGEYVPDEEWLDSPTHKETWKEDEMSSDQCTTCGEKYDEFGATCGCNM